MKNFSYLWIVAALLFSIVSCSKDDDQNTPQDQPSEYVPTELSTLQKHLVQIDDNGNFVARVLGVSLDPSDTTVVTVGVENYDEAVSVFTTLFNDTTLVSEDKTTAHFTTEKGEIRLEKFTELPGQIARVTFDVPGLKYITAINFILNSAWPENVADIGYHKLGAIYEAKGWTGGGGVAADTDHNPDEMFRYVCIREYRNGVPALLVAITPTEYYKSYRNLKYDGNMPYLDMAKEISNILRTDWDTYVSYFNQAYPNVLDKGTFVWTRTGGDSVFLQKRWEIRLSDGWNDWRDVHWAEPRHKVMFYLLSARRF